MQDVMGGILCRPAEQEKEADEDCLKELGESFIITFLVVTDKVTE